MRSGWVNFTGPGSCFDFAVAAGFLGAFFAASFFAVLLPVLLVDLVAVLVGIGVSRTISLAGLSSRSPSNTAWRTFFCAVQPANVISATSFGSTQIPLRPRSSSGSLPNAGVSRRHGCILLHYSRAVFVL